MGYVETILEPGERIIHRAYVHWIIYLRAIVLLPVGALLMLFAAPMDDSAGFFLLGVVGLAVFLLGAMALLAAAIVRWTTEIAVTNQRVILKRGLIRRDTIEVNMPKVESVDVRQSVVGRLLNYGTVIVRGTGGSFDPLAFVSEPLPLRRAVMLPEQTPSKR